MASQPLKHHRVTLYVWTFCAYAALSVIQAWPLPLHLSTHLPGAPGGDTGVYVWNLWVFKHQLVDAGATPFRTLDILPLDGPTDLSLHNYTVFANVLALPLLDWLGVVRTFNIIYLFNVTLAGFGVFLLARKLTGRPAESFVGGLLFMWSPFLVTRGQSHFSLVAAAALPIFLVALLRAWDTRRPRDAALVGLTIAWAAFSDPYYAVYCLMLGGCFVTSRVWNWSIVRRPGAEWRPARYVVSAAVAAVAGLILLIDIVGGAQAVIGPIRFSMRTLYTPVLALTLLLALRVWVSWSMCVRLIQRPSRQWMMRSAFAAGVVACLLMSPVLSALGSRMVKGGMVAAPVLWRSSAPGVDLLSFLIPNPNHALSPAWVTAWLQRGPGGYADQVASLSLVGLLLIVVAWRVAAFRPPRFWLAVTVFFALMTLGPFITVGRISTYIPTPWTLLRYVPIVGAARMPARFDVVVMLGFSMMVTMALVALVKRYPAGRRLIPALAGIALAIELFPGPRTIYSAAVPAVYKTVAADPRPVRLLRLPTGVRDGLSSIGNFGAQTQYYQTFHQKGLVGGYLSRVDQGSKLFYRRLPVMNALMTLSEGRALEPHQADAAMSRADDFLRRSNIGYVVWRPQVATEELRSFAKKLFGLTKIAEVDGYELFVPRRVN